jgi:methylphosphotriester-DNA--protein-cysteine methyltransferase
MKRRNLLKVLMAATLVCASVTFAANGAMVKANKKSKVYHKSECRHYNAKGSTVEFQAEADAIQAGYKACKQCGKAKAAKKSDVAATK